MLLKSQEYKTNAHKQSCITFYINLGFKGPNVLILTDCSLRITDLNKNKQKKNY